MVKGKGGRVPPQKRGLKRMFKNSEGGRGKNTGGGKKNIKKGLSKKQ